MRAACLLLLFALSTPALAQEAAVPKSTAKARFDYALRSAIESWVRDFHRGVIRLDGTVHLEAGSSYEYVKLWHAHRLFPSRRRHKTTHVLALHELIATAEKHPSAHSAAALLQLAACGYDHDELPRAMRMVRDIGHSALLRAKDDATRRMLEATAKDGKPAHVVLRLAALKVLGMMRQPFARTALESGLDAAAARIRFQAAEGLGMLRHADSLPRLAKAIATERHPVIAIVLLDAADRTLQQIARERKSPLVAADWAAIVDAALTSLGNAGWRHDLATVRFVRRYPRRAAIPVLIKLLRAGEKVTADPMLARIKRDTTPLLVFEAWQSLRRMTGALLPSDAAKWEAFWAEAGSKIKLAAATDDDKAKRSTQAKGGFFGIPIRGRNVVFVLDTSHSMREAIDRDISSGKGRGAKIIQRMRRSRRKPDLWRRIDAAKEQVLVAVAEMNEKSFFRVITFADDVKVWHKKPVRARRLELRRLMKTLDRVRHDGFTNTWAALEQVLKISPRNLDNAGGDQVDEVFVLSDGEPSVGMFEDIEQILAEVRKRNRIRQVRINTVFTGDGDGAAFMRKLAAQNHGVFVHYAK